MAALRQHPRTHRLVSSGGTSSPISSSATTAAAAREGSDRCGRRLRSCLGFLGEGDEPRNASRAKEGEDTGHHQSINPLRQKNPLTRPLSFSSLLRRVPLCLQRRRKAEGGSDDFYCNSGPNLAYYIVYTLCPLRHAILATSVHLDMQFWRAILAMFGWEVKNFVPRLLNEVYLQKHFHR
jgi:hypothetical protein